MIAITERMMVSEINPKQTHEFILNLHYAQRLPSISYAFGLFDRGELIAVLTIGKPASNSLCFGVCGEEHSRQVYELNRLICLPDLPKNSMSFFVGKCLKMLSDTDLILISYADEGAGHHGYVYQATNWWYTGKTKSRTDKYTPAGKHSRHYNDENNHLRKLRSSKYRYVYIPNKRLRKQIKRIIKYPILDYYPKGDNEKYTLGERIKQGVLNRQTGEVYYE